MFNNPIQIDQPEIIVNQPQAPGLDGFTPIQQQPSVITPEKIIEKTKQNLLLLDQLTKGNIQ